MKISTVNRNLWEQVADYLALVPSPISGFDLFNYMGPMVFTRGRTETADVLKQLIAETEENIKNGKSTYPAKEEFRFFWEGIACWHHSREYRHKLNQFLRKSRGHCCSHEPQHTAKMDRLIF